MVANRKSSVLKSKPTTGYLPSFKLTSSTGWNYKVGYKNTWGHSRCYDNFQE